MSKEIDDIMNNLEDCLIEVFDKFGIESAGWFNHNNVIVIYNIFNCDLLYRISDYIESKSGMIGNRLGYDITVGCDYNIGRIYIKPLVPLCKDRMIFEDILHMI